MTDEVKDPERLVASAEDPLLRDALRAGEAELGTSEQLAIVAAKLGPVLGGGGGAGGASSGGGAGAASKGASSLLGTTAKLAVSLGLGAIVAASAGYVAVRSPSETAASSRVATPPAPALVASSASVLDDEPSSPPPLAEPAPASTAPPAMSGSPRRAIPVRSISIPPPSLPSEAQESEVRILQRAQDALTTEPARALSICDEHARRFPSGLLNEEREVIAIDALTRLGRTDHARARARRFRGAHPSSSHLGRIEVLVGKDL